MRKYHTGTPQTRKLDSLLMPISSNTGVLGIEAGAGADLIVQVNNLLEFARNAKVLVADGDDFAAFTSLEGQFGSLELREIYRQYLTEAFSGNKVK